MAWRIVLVAGTALAEVYTPTPQPVSSGDPCTDCAEENLHRSGYCAESEENCLDCSAAATFCVPTPRPTASPTPRPSSSPTTPSPTTLPPTPRPSRPPTPRPTPFPTRQPSPSPTKIPTSGNVCCFYSDTSDPCDCEPGNSARTGFCVMSEENCLACSPTAAYCVPTPHPTPSPTLRPSLSPTTLSPTTPQPTPRPTRSPTLRPTQFPTVSPYPTITPTTTSLCCFYWESSDPCDCEPLNSAKSGFCVLSEENCLICSPTAAFCAAPPTPMLTMPPTRRPTAKTTTTTTTTTCADSSDWYKASEPEKDCSWVSSFTEARCVVKGEDETFAYQSCPSSCSTCETECEGDDPEFYVTDPSKDCTWVGQARTVRCKKEGTTGYAYAQCKHACGLCAYEECTDDDDAWQMPGDPSKDCDWVGDFRQNRCVKVGADGTYAYESCRHSCKSCAETLTGSCSDSTSWFKKDDPSKDCDWVGNLLPTRCAVKGDDDTWAFEACPFTCDVC